MFFVNPIKIHILTLPIKKMTRNGLKWLLVDKSGSHANAESKQGLHCSPRKQERDTQQAGFMGYK